MRCPKCYGAVEKITNKCKKCGFDLNTLKEATNKKAKEKFRSGDGDLVLYTKKLPIDVSKTKLALFCGFLGLFGAHYFYIGKMFRGFLNLVISVFAIVFLTFYMLNQQAIGIFAYIEYFVGIAFGVVLIETIFDFINIIFNRFKVPVYFEEE